MRYWTRRTDSNGKYVVEKMLSRGIFEEIVHRVEAAGGMAQNSRQRFNEEYLKLVLNRMVAENGVEILYQTTAVKADCTDGRINSVDVYNVSGMSRIYGRVFIDATGDANLAFLAGFPYKVGRESDGLCQPMTLCFRLAGVDMEAYRREKPLINELYDKYRSEGRITNPRENVLVFGTTVPGILHFNTTRVVKLDPTDARDVTLAEFIAREQIFELVEFLRDNFDAFRNCHIISSGMQIGVRESRMIEGVHTLNKDEMLSCTRFDDAIAACNYDIDIHSPDGSGTSHYYFTDGKYYTIPYRCLLPRGSNNLLVAGRCISATHEAQASIRIMPTCCTLGEAAGVAAAMAVKNDIPVTALDTDELRELLRLDGAVID